MEILAADLVSAFDGNEMTFGEFADAVRFAKPELATYIAALFGSASLIRFRDEDRRRYAALVAAHYGHVSLAMN